MLHIKRIEISGFKTFKNKTTVPLNRGLTIITGPNGSGKSNIFDAVKFALGELSAKKMRGESLSALVHKGIQSSSSSAFVSVEFDNRNRKIPLDSDTVTISREFRNEGEGIYRLNDKRASRKQLTILLASADIELLIYNFVGQNALTRLAEQNATDRREMLEDFLGLGVYDEKKAALGTQLQLIEVNAKVESARIEEVQSRVESLERERNTYLRSRQLENEINQLQTQIISRKINHARLELGEMEGTISKHQETLQNLQMQQDKLTEQKDTLEKEIWATQDAAYEDAKNRLETIQQTMIELTTNIATNRAAKNISEMNMKLLEDRKASLQKTLDQNLASIDETKKELPTLLTTKLEELQRTINHTEKSIEECSTQLEERTPEAKANQEDEHAIKVLTERVSKAQVHKKTCSMQIENLKEKLQTLQAQKGETENLIQTYTQRIQELHTAKEEQAWIQETKSKIDEIINVKSKYEKELEQAIDVENRCLTALVEIETQRRLVNLRPEEAALQAIQQKVAEGKISGVYGTLGSQVRPKNGCARAVEAAAAGWMKALIVKDFQTVVSCIEILKTLKIGRIKLIPLELLTRGAPQRLPDKITGIIGPITEQLIYEESLKPAVECVFGNTVLASNQKSAFLASLNNVRAVAESGDLYEPDGAMEAGHFRQSPDMISQTADQMIGQLKTIFTNFQEVTRKARDNIARLEKETKHLSSSRSQSESYIRRIERDLYNFEEHLTHVRERREEIDSLAVCTTRELATEQAVLVACQFKHDKLQTELEHALEAYNAQNRSSHDRFFAEISDQRSKLTDELNKLSLTRTEIEQRIKFLTSTMTSLQEAINRDNNGIGTIEQRLIELASEFSNTQIAIPQLEEQLNQLESDRSQLENDFAEVTEKRERIENQLKQIESDISRIRSQIDRSKEEIARLLTSRDSLQAQIDLQVTQLKPLGYNERMQVSDMERQNAENTLPSLRRELASIGAVNGLAVTQYEEAKDNYKRIAAKIYSLEKEKLSIVQVTAEINNQKLEAFMKAFNQINSSFAEVFAAVTGGTGRLLIEKPDSPFERGVETRLQFPRKNEMTIGSASGGEKSVATVCFVLALQAYHPMPFYMIDEMDAHLDPANTEKLADLLKARSKNSQFVLISLKDVTIARGDKVHGIFVQDGASRLITLPLQQLP